MFIEEQFIINYKRIINSASVLPEKELFFLIFLIFGENSIKFFGGDKNNKKLGKLCVNLIKYGQESDKALTQQ
jgi:hypothetical protein